MEQRPALAPGRRGDGARPFLPRGVAPRLGRQVRRSLTKEGRILQHRHQRAADDLGPGQRIGQRREVASYHKPKLLTDRRRQTLAHGGVGQHMERAAAVPFGEQPVEQRRAHVSHVQKPGRAGRKSDNGI
jgi:hypothetical protein